MEVLRERVLPGPAPVPRNVYYVRLGDRANPYWPRRDDGDTDDGEHQQHRGNGRRGTGAANQPDHGRRKNVGFRQGDESGRRGGYDPAHQRRYGSSRRYNDQQDDFDDDYGYGYDDEGRPGNGHSTRMAMQARSAAPQRREPPPATTSAQPSIRFLHVQGDDLVISLTGAPSYVLELRLRGSPNVTLDGTHPYVYSMTPFLARAQLPHAEGRLLGVRARALRVAGGRATPHGPWTPWHSWGAGRFREDYSGVEPYVAPPYADEDTGETHSWSGAAPWRAEIFGGDEPYDREAEAIAAAVTPGPGAYDTLRHGGIGSLPLHKRGPTPSFASSVGRDGSSKLRPSASERATYRLHGNYERVQGLASRGTPSWRRDEQPLQQAGQDDRHLAQQSPFDLAQSRPRQQPPQQRPHTPAPLHPRKPKRVTPRQQAPAPPTPPPAEQQWAKSKPPPSRAEMPFDLFPVEEQLGGSAKEHAKPTKSGSFQHALSFVQHKGGPLPPRTSRPELARPRVIDAWAEWANMPDTVSLPKSGSQGGESVA
jgi:hypothetical protein